MAESRADRFTREFFFWLENSEDEDRFDRTFGDQDVERKDREFVAWND